VPGATQLAGSFEYDSNAPGTTISNSSGDFGIYTGNFISVDLPLGTVLVDGLSNNFTQVNVRDNVNFGFGVNDQFLF